MKLIIAVLLQAVAFYVLNLVPGIHFTGSFWNAICYGIFFGLVSIVVNIALMAATAAFGIATQGIGIFIGIILYILRLVDYPCYPVGSACLVVPETLCSRRLRLRNPRRSGTDECLTSSSKSFPAEAAKGKDQLLKDAQSARRKPKKTTARAICVRAVAVEKLFNLNSKDMKEYTVFNQLRLIKMQRSLRHKQIDSVAGAVCSFVPKGKNKQAKVFEHLAMYLTIIAQYVDDTMQSKIADTEAQLNKLHELVGEAPVDACLAQSLGLLQGANIVSQVSNELLSRAQTALNHASALTLGQHPGVGLPMFANDAGEDLVVACLDTHEKCNS